MLELKELLKDFDVAISRNKTVYDVVTKNMLYVKQIKELLKANNYVIALVHEIIDEDEDGNELHYAIIKVAA